MDIFSLTFLAFVAIVGSFLRCNALSDQTSTIGLSNIKGTFAAYGDFNSDQATDVFVISDDCK